MPQLAEFPAGHTMFVDATCFIYHFTGAYQSCALFFERARRRECVAATSVAVLAEVHHRLMALEAAQQAGRPLRNPAAFLKAHPDTIRTLQRCEWAFDRVRAFRLRVFPTTTTSLHHARRLSHELGLLTTDALTVAMMRARHIVHLASNDTDFLRVRDLTLWRP